ncbi:MAG: tetratricopeptide repeat protein, partial [Armatimonadota bacterium]
LYEVMSAGRPIVVLATVQQPSEAATDQDGLAALRPAGFLAQATIHRPQVTAADLVALARKLSLLGLQAGAERPADGQTDLIAAVRCLRGADPLRHLWQDLEAGAALPDPHQAMVALCGVAELGLPESLWVPVLGEKALPRWERAGLLAQEDGLALPPHRSVCLDFVRHREDRETVVTEALQAFAALTADVSPEFMPRLLFGLSRCEELVAVVRAWVSGLQPLPPQADCPAALQRLWRHVFDALDIPYEATATGGDTPPELSLLVNLAFDRADYTAALQFSRRLSHNAVYQAAARFNTALALAHLGQLAAAEAELANVSGATLGTHYLRGLVAEASGDYVKALDAFEASRKAGELQLAATRRLAHCFIRSGAPRSAIPLLESALSYEPLRPDLYGGLAVAHLHAGMVQRAAAQSARAIQAGVEPSAARKAVARACAEAHAYDRAATELEACVAFDPSDLEAWRDLAAACRWLGRFTREEECLQRVQLVDPDDPATVYQMALCQRDQGRPEQTAKLLEPLLTTLAEANHPLAIPALLLAAEVAGTGGEADRQRALALQAVELGDATGWAQYWLADSYSDPTPEAHTAYRRAVTVFLEALEEGIPPRRAAKLWQAVYLAAVKLNEDALATKAERRARQEVSVCEVLGAEIESVFHRRTVPTEVFNESLPSSGAEEGQGSSRDETRSAPVVEVPIIRTRLGGRASGRS